MESIKDASCFLNELDFIEQINSIIFKKLRCVKQRLVFEFEDSNVSKLMYVSTFVVDMSVSIITNDLKDFVEKTPYEKIFYINLVLNILLKMLMRLQLMNNDVI